MSKCESFSLYLEEYCNGCGDFEADVETIEVSTFGDKAYITNIRCKNADKCRKMNERLI